MQHYYLRTGAQCTAPQQFPPGWNTPCWHRTQGILKGANSWVGTPFSHSCSTDKLKLGHQVGLRWYPYLGLVNFKGGFAEPGVWTGISISLVMSWHFKVMAGRSGRNSVCPKTQGPDWGVSKRTWLFHCLACRRPFPFSTLGNTKDIVFTITDMGLHCCLSVKKRWKESVLYFSCTVNRHH